MYVFIAYRAPSGGVGGATAPMMSAAEFASDVYNMSHKERGLAIIFNNKKFDPKTNMGER